MADPKAPSVLLSVNTTWNVVNFRSGLIRALQAAGFSVVVASPPDAYVQALKALGVRYEPLAMAARGTSVIADARLWLSYRRLMQALRPDVYLAYTIKPNIFGSLAAAQLKIPVINNISGLGSMFIHRSWMTSLVSFLYRHALKTSHTVFFQNQDDADLFLGRKLVQPAQCALLPGSGIDLTHFLAQAPSESPAFRFLFVGRMLWEKGIGEYVAAAKMLLESWPLTAPKPIFQVLGARDGQASGQVPDRQWAAWLREGLIEDLGSTHDVRPYLAQAHCVVLPSYREGTPRALLEAAASARPMIAARVPGCVEVVREGLNGYLCEARNAKALAACMRHMLALSAEQRQAMGEAARSDVAARFDEQKVFSAYLQAIHTIPLNPAQRI
ncbi:MAG: glycosyltransferase family 1 protein [Betaproteobacteria bacterium]|nr:glycosyltransferase family 1 protein [Betaproteobacteria bacterium]